MILDHRGNPINSELSGDVGPLNRAGSTSDRMDYWGLSGSGPNAGQGGLVAVRKRTRHLERNDPTVKGAVDSFVSNMVGVAITPDWQLQFNPVYSSIMARLKYRRAPRALPHASDTWAMAG